jgi:ribosome-associated protein
VTRRAPAPTAAKAPPDQPITVETVAGAPAGEDPGAGDPEAVNREVSRAPGGRKGTATRVRAVAKARKAAAEVDRSSLDVARRIVELAEDKKAADIVLLDVSELTTIADAFVICSGGSERQLDAIAGGIVDGLRDEGIRPIGREGTPASHWVLVDFGIVIVHVFTPPERDFYQLEKHWSEARTILRVQ